MENEPGKITRQEDGFKVVFERILDHDIDKVWEAITSPGMLKYWFTDIEMDFRPGGEMTFTNRDEEKSATHGEIISIDRPNRFEHTWEGDLAIWELFLLGKNKCKLRLSYSKIDHDFVVNTPVGWHLLLDRLRDMLGGRREILPFGEDVEDDPEFQSTKREYTKIINSNFPELKV